MALSIISTEDDPMDDVKQRKKAIITALFFKMLPSYRSKE